MKTPSFISSPAAVRSAPGVLLAASACLIFLLPSVMADSALLLDGSRQQRVEVPFGETIIVEDQWPRFVAPQSAWTSAASIVTNASGGSSLKSSETNATARWTPDLPRAGSYEVYMWCGGGPVPFDAAAQYVVKHAGGLSTNTVPQTNWNTWAPLGTFNFQGNHEEYVSVRPSGNGTTVADAVRFVNKQAFDLAQSLTVETWVQTASLTNAWQPIITKGRSWELGVYSNHIVFRTRDGNDIAHDLLSTNAITTARLHVAATFDGNTKRLYIGGAAAGYAIWQNSLVTNAYPVWFGGCAETPLSSYFTGQLDNTRIWSVVRSAAELQTYATNKLRGNETGLLGEWRFDDFDWTHSLTWDSGAGALHGALQGITAPTSVTSVTFGPPLAGSLALKFNGYDECVTVPNASDSRFDFTNSCTIETWVYFDFPPAARVSLISKGAGAWELALNQIGKIVFRTGAGPHELPGSARLDPGKWYHVAAVWDRTAKRKSIYLNGLLDATVCDADEPVLTNTNPLYFASPGIAGSTNCFEGILDEVRFWSVARTSERIAENYAHSVAGTEPGLVGGWSFDEGSGPVASNATPYSVKIHGVLSAGMTNLNRFAGRSLGLPLLLQYCAEFNGTNSFVQIGSRDIFNVTNLTIEAWVKPTGTNVKTILMKGADGYGLAIDANNYLRYYTDGTFLNSLRSSRTLNFDQDSMGNPIPTWNHVGVVVNRAANTTTFYINGQPAGAYASSVVNNNTGALVLGKQGGSLTNNCFQGQMDEVRLWNIPRSSVEIDLYAFTPLLGTTPPGLVGYWTFNEGTGLSTADQSFHDSPGTFANMGVNAWQDGTDWNLPALPGGLLGLIPNTNAAGLWIGHVVLNKVNEVQKATGGTSEVATETGHPATVRLLLHVGTDGQVRLLKDVIVMKKPTDTNAPPDVNTNPVSPVALSAPATNLVLVTRPELIPNYQGVMKRGGKLVGLRYGTAAYDFSGTDLPFLGGVGPSAACLGRISLSKDHPTNPYRHKYHPDHRSGFDIVRQITMQFDGAPGDPWQESPGYGMDRLTGTYRETVVGLHKVPLLVEGTVRLDRVNTVGVLNDGQ